VSRARAKKSGSRSSTREESAGRKRKKSATKRVKEVRADAFRHGANTILLALIVILFVVSMAYIWSIMGRPGFSAHRADDHLACIELYFYDSAVAYLVPIHRRIEMAPNDKPTERALHEFAIGPRDPSLARVYPANIPIPSVRIERDTAVVDLPVEIKDRWGGARREREFLNALTRTVTAAGECSKVRVLIAGEPQEATPAGFALDKPLTRPEFINRVREESEGDQTAWTSAYFLDSSGRYLFPLAIEIPAGADRAMEAVKAILEYPPVQVEPPPLPVAPMGYSLDRLAIENGVATVDMRVPDPFTAFFTSDINLFRRALYLTLKDCCNVENVAIELNGRPLESYGRFSNLPDITRDDCWNLEEGRPSEKAPTPVSSSGEDQL